MLTWLTFLSILLSRKKDNKRYIKWNICLAECNFYVLYYKIFSLSFVKFVIYRTLFTCRDKCFLTAACICVFLYSVIIYPYCNKVKQYKFKLDNG